MERRRASIAGAAGQSRSSMADAIGLVLADAGRSSSSPCGCPAFERDAADPDLIALR